MHTTDQRAPLGRAPLSPATRSPDADTSGPSLADGAPPAPAAIWLEAPALLVEARFREITLASRVIKRDRAGSFTIGAGRRADAPVNPAWLTGTPASDPATVHPLVERTDGGFVLNLAPSMRAELRTPVQRLILPPDAGRAESPLALPVASHLRIACGEVTFEVHPAEATAPLPRPLLPAGWRDDLPYLLGVALVLAAVLGIARLVPADPRALSLDDIGAEHRSGHMVTIPLDVNAPAVEHVLQARRAAGGGGPAAAGPSGQAGSRRSTNHDGRLAIAGTARPADAREAAARIQSSGLLALLRGAPTSAVADVLASGPVLGAEARNVLGNLQGTTLAEAWGPGGLGFVGIGSGRDGTGDRIIGTGELGTIGRRGPGGGGDVPYGSTAGKLATRRTRVPDVISDGASVRGSLDKEIIRRTVRRHLNEVRYCYEQALTTRPALQGRLVVQFTIAPTGRVLATVLQSSTMAAPAVDACVVQAVKRWEFPQPEGGGLVMVSYPFQLSPAGG